MFAAYHLPALAAIAFVTAAYHMTNHSFYKTLLMLGTGAVEEQGRHAGSGQAGRADSHHALDGLALSRRGAVDSGVAPLQWLCERMADAPNRVAQRGVVVYRREDHRLPFAGRAWR